VPGHAVGDETVEDLHHGGRQLHQLSAAAGRLDKAGAFGLEQNLAHRGPRYAEPRADIGAGKTGIKTLSRAGLALPIVFLSAWKFPLMGNW
jgi:hypothetical protein